MARLVDDHTVGDHDVGLAVLDSHGNVALSLPLQKPEPKTVGRGGPRHYGMTLIVIAVELGGPGA